MPAVLPDPPAGDDCDAGRHARRHGHLTRCPTIRIADSPPAGSVRLPGRGGRRMSAVGRSGCATGREGRKVWRAERGGFAVTEQSVRHEVIDSDGHVIEPDTVWSEYAEPEFRELLSSGVGGYVQATGITAPIPTCRRRSSPAAVTTTHVGGCRGGHRLGRGVEAQDESPGWSRPGGPPRRHGRRRHRRRRAVPDDDAHVGRGRRRLRRRVVVPYNHWLPDYCSAAPDRLYRRRLVPLQDPDAAVTEMRAARRAARLQGGDDPPGAVPREQEAQRPRLRPVLGRGRGARLPDRCAPFPHGDMPNS